MSGFPLPPGAPTPPGGGATEPKKKELTLGEMVQVMGRATERLGKALDDPQTPKKVTLAEAMQVIQATVTDVLAEWSD